MKTPKLQPPTPHPFQPAEPAPAPLARPAGAPASAPAPALAAPESGTCAPAKARPARIDTRDRSAYQADRRRHSYALAFKDDAEKLRFAQMAEEAGYASFNAYLMQMLRNATSGAVFPPEYVDGLRKEVEKLRAWLDQAREEASELRKDGKILQAEKDTLIFLLNGLPEGKQALEDFERQHGKKTHRGVA